MIDPNRTRTLDQGAASFARRHAEMEASWSPEIREFARELGATIDVARSIEDAERLLGLSAERIAELAAVPLEDVARIKEHDETVSATSRAAIAEAIQTHIRSLWLVGGDERHGE